MKRLLSSVALTAILSTSGAQAANYVLTLTGDMSSFTSSSFLSGTTFFETGLLELSGFAPFTLQDGDTIEATVDITGGPFTVPTRDQMFFGLNFDNILTGAQPTDAQSTGLISFDGAPSLGAGCGNCISLIYGQNGSPLSFVNLVASGSFTLGSDYDVDHITVSYQVNNDPTAVPEPATWGLMIAGFGGAGAMLRHRRRVRPRVAA